MRHFSVKGYYFRNFRQTQYENCAKHLSLLLWVSVLTIFRLEFLPFSDAQLQLFVVPQLRGIRLRVVDLPEMAKGAVKSKTGYGCTKSSAEHNWSKIEG
jgi:hypothetical protein